jgi:hypothetical protein
MINSFKDYYLKSLFRETNDDIPFDGTEEWFDNHKAYTKKKSLTIGIVDEYDANWRNYIDFNILPTIFSTIRENDNLIYLTNDTTPEKYIQETIQKKFPEKNIKTKIIDNNVTREIRLAELDNMVALVTPDNSTTYTLKLLIEYI